MFEYPSPARKLPFSKNGDVNIGFAQGEFLHGRPFHAEYWAGEGTTHMTFFFSPEGIEDYR